MKIELQEISVRDVYDGYLDSAEGGVVAYGGRLNVRPAYQREFIYKDKQRDEVIRTVQKGFPLNTLYWAKNGEDDYEMLDGQQRTISLCQYVNGDFSIDHMTFDNLTDTERQQILDYKLMIYVCEGTDKEKLDWFKIINIAGEELTQQELRNAVYTGKWLTDAKKHFSKKLCPAHQIADKYLKGSAERQDYLETALSWVADRDGIAIEDYMSTHQHDLNCNELWLYFQSVIAWIGVVFPDYRKEMKGLPWGVYYNKYSGNAYDAATLESRIVALMEDDDVTKKSGIYEYLLDGSEKHLSIRSFSKSMARSAYTRQKGVCPKCGKHFEIGDMQADHITPWSKGGKTTPDNCQMLCADCNRRKSNL